MAMEYLVIEPIDVVNLRGNRLFAEATGDNVVMPPWPSLFAGALRSRMLVDRGVDFRAFTGGCVADPDVRQVLGESPAKPGSFAVCGAALVAPGRKGGQAEVLVPCPADLVVWRTGPRPGGTKKGEAGPALECRALQPADLVSLGVRGSFPLPATPVLRRAAPAKGESDVWLTLAGLEAHLASRAVPAEELRLRSPERGSGGKALWDTDPRLGIALASGSRTTRKGLLYVTDAVALGRDVAFLVACSGAGALLPRDGLVRLGGDGRGAAVRPWTPREGQWLPWTHRPRPTEAERFRIVLATPGLFAGGWIPPGVTRDGQGPWILTIGNLKARLVAAAVGRGETVSGWDLARGAPKAAVRAVPAGSVYWFELLEGSLDALEPLLTDGWWDTRESGTQDWEAARRVEGYNRVWLGTWDGQVLKGNQS